MCTPSDFTATMCHLGVNSVPKVDITIAVPQGAAHRRQAGIFHPYSTATSLSVGWGKIFVLLFLREATSLLKGTR